MVLYAASGRRRLRQLLGDLAAVIWCGMCLWIGTVVHGVVEAIAEPARHTARASSQVEARLVEATNQLNRIPAIGDDLAGPFTQLRASVADITAQANAQAALIGQAALVIGVVSALVPIVMTVALWLPRRVRFSREATAAQRFIDAQPDLDLFALRAMASLPMTQLAKISDDPVGAWRRGDRDTITALAERELHRVGLRVPKRLDS